MPAIISLNNISFSVETRDTTGRFTSKRILNSVSFDLEKYRIVGIVGNSGCGKTTLAKIMSGIIKSYTGEMLTYFDKNSEKESNVQLLFQNSVEIINPLRKVKDIFEESLKINQRNRKSETFTKVDNMLQNLNLDESILGKYCYQLSGGERQRVALGRILAVDPELLILDEPFSAQDIVSQVNLYNVLLSLRKTNNVTIVVISHNLNLLDKLTDQLIIMNDGEIVEKGDTKKIIGCPSNSFTKFFIKSAQMDLKLSDFS